jgi:hypothetical protein
MKHTSVPKNLRPRSPYRLTPGEHYQEIEITLEDLEYTIYIAASGNLHDDLVALREAIRPGDRLIEFCSDLEHWKLCFGLAGYKLRRGDEDVVTILLKVS